MSDTMHHRLQGPRIRWQSPEDSPYETITDDKLTPIIGAEIGGEARKPVPAAGHENK